MERMWQERADYGHFFYRIPNGESAADAYDRISGFNESLWRQFGDDSFPSVCILVTHGLMTRVFLMKWFKYSVEYFENLRNIRHCEFVIMELNEKSSYELKSTLRTWSDLQQGTNKEDANPPTPQLPARRWGGCINGCNHKLNFPRRTKRLNAMESLLNQATDIGSAEYDDHPIACQDVKNISETPTRTTSVKKLSSKTVLHDFELNPTDGGVALPHIHDLSSADDEDEADQELADEGVDTPWALPPENYPSEKALRAGRDGGGSTSGVASPAGFSDDSDYFSVVEQQERTTRVAFRSTLNRSQITVTDESASDLQRSDEKASSAKYRQFSNAPGMAKMRDNKAMASIISEDHQHSCRECGRPFDNQPLSVNPDSADTEALGTPGEEGTAQGDIY
jgi:hypothetical protein